MLNIDYVFDSLMTNFGPATIQLKNRVSTGPDENGDLFAGPDLTLEAIAPPTNVSRMLLKGSTTDARIYEAVVYTQSNLPRSELMQAIVTLNSVAYTVVEVKEYVGFLTKVIYLKVA